MALIDGLNAIGDAIREKTSTSSLIPFKDMPDKIRSIPNGTDHTATTPHINQQGKWVKPDDWDDIESIELPTDRDEVYYLYDCHRFSNAFCCLYIVTKNGTGTVEWGRVSNGAFIQSDDCIPVEIGKNSTKTFKMVLANRDDDYLVVKVSGSAGLSYVRNNDWTADDIFTTLVTRTVSPILMRYGRLAYGLSGECKSMYIESDNIKDFASAYWNNTSININMGAAYQYDYNLQRIRFDGWDLSKNKVTTFSTAFQGCMLLQDFNDGDNPNQLDISNWITSYTTIIGSMFNHCRSIKKLIVNGWDLSNITDASSAFVNMRSLISMDGINTWTGGQKLTNMASFLSGNFLLESDVDFSGMQIAQNSNGVNMQSIVNNCQTIRNVKLGALDLSNVSNFNAAFQNTYSLESIDFSKCINTVGSKCTSISNIFNTSGLLSIEIDGWNLSHITTISNMSGICKGCNLLRTAKITNIMLPSSINDGTLAYGWFGECYSIKSLDMTGIDYSCFTNAGIHTTTVTSCNQLVDWIPPTHIHKNFTIKDCNSLSHESMLRIIENLDTVDTATTLTLGSSIQCKLTNEEKTLITSKGWTIA